VQSNTFHHRLDLFSDYVSVLLQANLSLDSCIAQLQRCIAHMSWIEAGMRALVFDAC
jgi:hypothetical protein